MRPPVGGRLVVREPACSLCPSCAPHRDGRTPARVELADTPFFPQTRYQCGPTALATVLNARGVTVTPDELVPRVYLPAREGSLQAEIKAAVRRQGLLAVPVEPGLDALLAEITAGHPVLVLQNPGFNWLPRWHYAVVVGYDLARQELVLRSGTEPRRITPFGVFLNTWNRSARWGIVVLVPGAFPAQAKPTPYLEVASALERLGQHQWASIRKPGRLTRHRPQDGPTIRWHGWAWATPSTPWAMASRPKWHFVTRSRTGRVWRSSGTIRSTSWLPANAYAKPGNQRVAPRVSGLKTPISRTP